MRAALTSLLVIAVTALGACDGGGEGDDAGPALLCEPSGRICDEPGEYCHWAPGACSSPGTCRPIPTDCSAEPDAEICGCDGVTYRNECEAHAVGQNVDHAGPCG